MGRDDQTGGNAVCREDDGTQPQAPAAPDWDRVKDDVMRLAVRAKFETHEDLRAELLVTADIRREPPVTPRAAVLRIAAVSTIPDTQ